LILIPLKEYRTIWCMSNNSIEIGRMWKELSEQGWKTHQVGPDELENTSRCVRVKFFHQIFCGVLIVDQHSLLEEENIGGKHQSHFLKGKKNMDPTDTI
jgi:hypothetical protein